MIVPIIEKNSVSLGHLKPKGIFPKKSTKATPGVDGQNFFIPKHGDQYFKSIGKNPIEIGAIQVEIFPTVKKGAQIQNKFFPGGEAHT